MESVRESNQVNPGKKIPQKSAKLCEYMPYSAREAFKRMRTNVLISLGEKTEKKNNIIGITSAQPSEGKSTVAINLAYSLAELGKSVMVLDCDLRRPTIHANMGTRQSPGLTEVLNGITNLNNAVIRYKSSTNNTFFDMVVAGDLPDNPSEILGSKNFLQLLNVVSKAYDVVLLDLPPVNAVIDAAVVAQLTDGLVLIIREDHCPRFVLKDCMEQLQYAKANILGFVMNGSSSGAGKRYKYGNAYRYKNTYYQYGQYGQYGYYGK